MPAQVYSLEVGFMYFSNFMELFKISQTTVEKVFLNETIKELVLFRYETALT
jgi:hypothetical protein